MNKLLLGFAAILLVLGLNALYIWHTQPTPRPPTAPRSARNDAAISLTIVNAGLPGQYESKDPPDGQ